MKLVKAENNQWKDIKKIYLEAFPKAERKPFFTLKASAKQGKAQIFSALEANELSGFIVLIPHNDLMLVDYLAVNQKIRSGGIGSKIMQEVTKRFSDKKIVLLIEKLNEAAPNQDQRISRRKFYLKNGFHSSNIYLSCVSGEMEVLNFGENITKEECYELLKYAIGNIFFKFSKMKFIN